MKTEYEILKDIPLVMYFVTMIAQYWLGFYMGRKSK